jgi:hypothetical protein
MTVRYRVVKVCLASRNNLKQLGLSTRSQGPFFTKRRLVLFWVENTLSEFFDLVFKNPVYKSSNEDDTRLLLHRDRLHDAFL